MIKNRLNPLIINIVNTSDKDKYFIPYRENQQFLVRPNGKVTFTAKTSEEALYYENQKAKGLDVNILEDIKTNTQSGVYDTNTSIFTSEASYIASLQTADTQVNGSAITQNTYYDVLGTIPYSEANATIGLAAGNRFTVRISNPEITSKSNLPSGTICSVVMTDSLLNTNNSYNKNAFEDDGSLIVITNVLKGTKVTVTIKWSNTLTSTYIFDCKDIVLGTQGQLLTDSEDINIVLPTNITLTNISSKNIAFVPYKENFNVSIAPADSIVMSSNCNNEVLYYLLQKNETLHVSI